MYNFINDHQLYGRYEKKKKKIDNKKVFPEQEFSFLKASSLQANGIIIFERKRKDTVLDCWIKEILHCEKTFIT